ncbi:threonine/serine dehydratase [Amylibacter sp.]|jgi:threonine dehydratase|nr:threonine/serine dehydratase [Amylibacter sp.]MDA9005269.1 threonine/serine dehydratase [Amylibacter sp.]MDA9293865.1 threonine/serine dehydratase [Amylibacter sp.]MDA9313530.1 threonine/serine dehydratase [Amylibacter sp.]MDA9329981.1 threonine/serine dehydratase [Amylibacter sp.]|tara:strand:+ start:5393 stop:6370 length:978 start_codon:yes stop_codon:yes gene_type:complete
MSNFQMILAAYDRIAPHSIYTPLLSSPFLDRIAKRRLWVKAECLQHTGSFKFRGGWSAISALKPKDRARGVITFSSGNHAQGIASAAAHHDVSATIIMPSDSPDVKIKNTKDLGAKVILYNRKTEDRNLIETEVNPDKSLLLIKPYDDHNVIAGQGSVGIEIAAQAKTRNIKKADVLVCSGGGGLASGIALSLEQLNPNMLVRTAEPDKFDDIKKSLKSGKIECNKHTSGSVCDAVLTLCPGDITFPILKRLCGAGFSVSDEEALRAMVLAFEQLRIVVEPGGAVALAAALFHGKELNNEDVIVVATGGNVDRKIFQNALIKYGK